MPLFGHNNWGPHPLVARNFFDIVVRNFTGETLMPRHKQADDGLTKFQRYRQKRQHRGMKLLRVWVPDPHRAEFAAEARRQGRLLRGAPEEVDTLAFIASAFEWPEQ